MFLAAFLRQVVLKAEIVQHDNTLANPEELEAKVAPADKKRGSGKRSSICTVM